MDSAAALGDHVVGDEVVGDGLLEQAVEQHPGFEDPAGVAAKPPVAHRSQARWSAHASSSESHAESSARSAGYGRRCNSPTRYEGQPTET